MHRQLNCTSAVVALVLFIGAATAGAASTVHASRATAPCAQWNIAGPWGSTASNGYHVSYRFTQNRTTLTGRASIPAAEAKLAGFSTGTLAGTLKGNKLRFIVTWAPRQSDRLQLRGLYVGTVTKGRVKGYGRDLTTKPTPQPAAWSATGPTRCART